MALAAHARTNGGKMNELVKAAQELIKYLEENNINDESCDDGDGYIDEWRSTDFETVIDNVKALL